MDNELLITLATYGGAFVAMLVTTFLRGFQNKNVAGGHKKLAFVFGGLMTAAEGITIALIVLGGIYVIIFTATGAAFGWVLGMLAHDRIMRKQRLLRKAKKKQRRKKQIHNYVNKQVKKLTQDDIVN